MQVKDVVSIEFFEKPERFADLLNGDLFGGKPVVRPEDVRERNRTAARIRKKNRRIAGKEIERDVVRSVSLGVKLVLVSLENQSDIHYAMPLRVMNGESVRYDAQWRKIRNVHKEKKDLKGAEFLSGFAKEDKLVPELTIVLYYGEEPWDAPRCLKEMLDLSELPKELETLVADYPMHLIEIRKYPNPERFQTDLRYVFEFLQNADDGDKLETYVTTHKAELSKLAEDTYDLINAMANTELLDEIKENNKNVTGGYNMCKGMEEWLERNTKNFAKNMYVEGCTAEYTAKMLEKPLETIRSWFAEFASETTEK